MSTTPTTPGSMEGNSCGLLPAIAELEPEDINAKRIEAIKQLAHDFSDFENAVGRQMEAYRKALSEVSRDMYKEVFSTLVEEDRIGFSPDPIFYGWHGWGYNACEMVKSGLSDMRHAFSMARDYCRIMQRREGGAA